MRFFLRVGDHYAQFERDDDNVATGRVDWVASTYEATGFEKLSDLAELAEYTHLSGYEVVNE